MQTKLLFYTAVTAAAVILYSCNNNSTLQSQKKDSTSVTAETNSAAAAILPAGHYNTAAPGQTRVAAIKTTTPYKVEKLAEKIGRPWAIIPMPDGKLLLTEKSGYMEIRNADGSLFKKITGFPKVDDRGQGGLLDVALDPSFSTNQMIYWSFSEKKDSFNLTAVAKGKLDLNDTVIKNPVIIFRATPALKNSEYHFGSRLLFDKDGYLFVTSGERSILEGRKQSQWLNSGLGKIFRITTNGKAAPGNPFIKKAGAKPEIYSYGHRNPQSLDAHPVTGDLWEAEFGPQGGDELNLIKPGKNYGWPVITYGVEYSGEKIGDSIQQKEGMEQPVYFWDPVLSPGGMIFYTGDAIPEWKNNLFICGLSSTRVVRLLIENDKVIGEEVLLNDQRERMRDIAQLNGMLYVVSDGGILFRISKK